jgi:hypothetical protein
MGITGRGRKRAGPRQNAGNAVGEIFDKSAEFFLFWPI